MVKPGDALEVLYKEGASDKRYSIVTGLCIGTKRPKQLSASFRLLCALGDEPVEFNFPLYSPLVQDVRLVQRAFHAKRGTKRVRRAKLYYMRDRPVSEFRTPPSQTTLEEREERIIEARRVSYEARMGKKERAQKAEMEAKQKERKQQKLDKKKRAREEREGNLKQDEDPNQPPSSSE